MRLLALAAAAWPLALADPSGRFHQGVYAAAAALWLACALRPPRASTGWMLAFAVACRAPFLASPHVSDDVDRYLLEGRMQREGLSPYLVAPDDPEAARLREVPIAHGSMTTVYPPLAQMSFAAAADLTPRGWRAVSLLFDALAVAALLAWLRAVGEPASRAVLYAGCPVAWLAAGDGHVDPLMLLLLALCGLAWARGRATWAGGLLAGAVLAKTVAILLLPWLALHRPRALVPFAAVLALGYLPYAHAGSGLFESLFVFGSEFAFNASLFRAAEGVAGDHARFVVAAALAFWILRVARRGRRFPEAAALTFAGLLVLSPTVHLWYLTWFLVALPAAGPRPWTLPLLAWAAGTVFLTETYRVAAGGGAFVEHVPLTAAEYLLPVAALPAALGARFGARARTADAGA